VTARPANKKATASSASAAPGAAAVEIEGSTETRQAPPSGVTEVFLPVNVKGDKTKTPVLYRPALLAQADARVSSAKYDVDTIMPVTALVPFADPKGMIDWEEHLVEPIDPNDLNSEPIAGARFAPLERPFTDAKLMKS
jgi:hypothetical protein